MKNHYHFVRLACTGILTVISILPNIALASKPTKLNPSPTSGKVLKFTNGDLMCYVDINSGGKKYHIGADFSICNQAKLLNQQVQLTYKPTKVNDCQSSEPCGKTRIENLIIKMKLIPQK